MQCRLIFFLFPFQEFDDPRDAEDAVYELDGKELCNERLFIFNGIAHIHQSLSQITQCWLFSSNRVTIEHARVRLRGGRGRGAGGGGRFPDRYGRGSQESRRYTEVSKY